MIALRVLFTRGVFHHSCFFKGVWRCLRQDVVIGNTPLFFSVQARGVMRSTVQEEQRNEIVVDNPCSGCRMSAE